MTRVYTRGPFEARFVHHVDRNGPVPPHRPELGPCHVWIGGKDKLGRGSFNLGRSFKGRKRKTQRPHRVAFLIALGRWPEPEAMHLCDNPSCVKVLPDDRGPAHVVEGSHTDNMHDMSMKGRHVSRVAPERLARGARHGSKTHPERFVRGEQVTNARLTEDAVRDIRISFARGERLVDLGRRYGVTYQCIDRIVRRINWAHVT